MARFRVRGTDRDMGHEVERIFEASDPREAEALSNEYGLLVTSVVEIEYQRPTKAPRRKRTNSFAIAAMVVGVFACLLAWIPIIGMIGFALGALGVVLGVVGLMVSFSRRGVGFGYVIAGLGTSALALVLSGAQWTVALNLAERAAEHDSVDSDWANATNPTRLGDFEIGIESARVGAVTFDDSILGSSYDSDSHYLVLDVSVSNKSASRKGEYDTWAARRLSVLRGRFALVQDDLGNTYRHIDFGISNDVAGAITECSIYPGETIRDVLVFQKPVAGVGELRVSLPGSALSEDGIARLVIPASMIQ